MFLVHALIVDEDAVICDLAETYGIFNYKGLPCSLVATLVFGLRDNSRIMMKLSDSKIEINRLILASMLDQLAFLAWTKTKSAQHNNGRPKSVVESLMNGEQKVEYISFDTPEEFERAREKIINGEV